VTSEEFQSAAHDQLSRTLGIARMSEEDMLRFVLDWCDGRIFSDQHVQQRAPHRWEETMALVFMPLAFGASANWTVEACSQLGIIYEYTDKALPRAINGMPCFLSMHVMHREDWMKCADAIERERKRRQEITL
jgi:hypothetical protein